MKLAKKSLSYALVFMAGTLVSGSVAFAATTYVKAQKERTTIQYQGNAIAHPAGLVYAGSTYVQLYSIEQALKQAGFLPGWDGSTLSLSENNVAKLSGGTSDSLGTYVDIGYASTSIMENAVDFIKSVSDANITDQEMISTDNQILARLNDNLEAIQKDTPSDSALIKLQNDCETSLKDYEAAYNDFNTYVQTGNVTYEDSFKADYDKADSQFQQTTDDFQAYPSTLTGTSQTGTANAPLAAAFKHNFSLK